MNRTLLAALLLCALLLAGCQSSPETTAAAGDTGTDTIDTTETSETTQTAGETAESASLPSELFTERDLEVGYDESTCVTITLQGDTASSDGEGVSVSGSTVTISQEGTYRLTGTLEGMVIVDVPDTAKVQLVLDGAQITSATSAALYVREADKVFLTTASGSENTLANGGEYLAIDDNNIDAAIFSKADLTLNGTGSLTVQAPAGHGVVSKDDLALTSGTYTITAASHGLSGKDSVRIANGTYTITAGKDGIHAENSDDTSLGFLYIANGTFQITAEGDGLSAATTLQVEDGSFQIQSGGGSANAPVTTTTPAFGRQEAASASATDTTEDTTSTKGVKASGQLLLNGGSFHIDSADDALHTNGSASITGGSFQIATGDDAVHADDTVTITGGTLDITQSYEGIEGLVVDISGGEISLVSSDDGLNAAGGADQSGTGGRGDQFAAESGAGITISGGELSICAGGDGIDSNGDLTVTGGTTYVSGPESSGNGFLDYTGQATITGGIFAAAGPSGMAQSFGDASTQGSMLVALSGQAGDTVTLTGPDGTLLSWQPQTSFQCVLLSVPELAQGETYTVSCGGTETQVTLSQLTYRAEGMESGMGGKGGGGMGGGGRGGAKGEPPTDGTTPPGTAETTPGESGTAPSL